LSILFNRGSQFLSWRWGGSSTQAWMPTSVSILRIPEMIRVLKSDGGMIYWQGKTEELREKQVPVPLCPPQIPHGLTPQILHGLTRARTRASAVRGRWLTTWAKARPVALHTRISSEGWTIGPSVAAVQRQSHHIVIIENNNCYRHFEIRCEYGT
jgi:hypothetical protein